MSTRLTPLPRSRQRSLHTALGGLLLITVLLGTLTTSKSAAPEAAPDPSRSLGEALLEWELQVAAVREGHRSALAVLEAHEDLHSGLLGLRRDIETLACRLPEDPPLQKLAEEARKIAVEVTRQLPTGHVSAEAAGELDTEALATARRASRLRTEITALHQDLAETGTQLQKWQNAYHAFDFDPTRQELIVRRLVTTRLSSLGEDEKLPQIPLDPSPKVAPPSLVSLLPPPKTDAPQEEIRRPLVIADATTFTGPEDTLVSALEQAVTCPEDAVAQAALNAACFTHLDHFGARLLSPSFQDQDTLSEHLLAHLESAARNESPAAQQLLGMMHLTGRGRGINYPRGVAYLKEAAAALEANPAEPFGPGVSQEQCATALRGVGTALFWLAESLLLGLMEQQPENAAACYQKAAQAGDPRAQTRIRQLSATSPTSIRTSKATPLPGLVELHQVDLADLESRLLATRSFVVDKKVKQTLETPTTPADDTLQPFTGLELAPTSPSNPGPGVRIIQVRYSSPAHHAGLRSGDLIIEANAQSTATLDAFQHIVAKASAGDRLAIRFLRADEPATQTQLVLGTITTVTDAVSAVLDPVSLPASWNPSEIGFQIFSVKPGSPAAAAGLRAGDVVLGANDRYLRHWNDFAAALNPPQGMTTLMVQRRSPTEPPKLVSVELLRR
jgi:hypothetical protein